MVWSIDWSADRWFDRLIDWSVEWLIDWLAGFLYYVNGIFFPGDILSPKDILRCYQHILANSKNAKPEDSIAVLSADERDHWAGLREQLVSAGNESLLKKLDSAVLLVCLDDSSVKDLKEPAEIKKYCKNQLHGNGSNR